MAIAKKHKNAKNPTRCKSGGRAKPAKIHFGSDSDALSSMTGHVEVDAYDPTYEKLRDNLVYELEKCRVCGPKEKLCLLDKHGKHRLVTAEMIRTWVSAMVCCPLSTCVSKLTNYIQRADVPNVTVTAPPKSTAFADFHHNNFPVSHDIHTRKDRRNIGPVEIQAPAQVPVPPVAPQFIYIPAPPIPLDHRRRRHSVSSSQDYYEADRHGDSSHIYPSVRDWLSSLETKVGADKRNFPSIRAKFDFHEYLEMDLDDLAGVPRSEYGEAGFKFNMAEVSFLFKWLEVSMAEYKTSRHNRKRTKHC